MPIEFTCNCGKTLRAPESAQGKRARCPRCSTVITVPAPDNTYALDLSAAATPLLASAPRNAAPLPPVPTFAYAPPPPKFSIRHYGYLLLVLTLIPLIISVFHQDTAERSVLGDLLKAHPELIHQHHPFLHRLHLRRGTLRRSHKSHPTALPHYRNPRQR